MNLFRNLFTLKNCDDEKSREELRFSNFSTEIIFTKKSNRLFILHTCVFQSFLVFNKEQAIGHRESLLSFTDSFGYSSFEIKVYSQLLLFLRPQETFSKEETPSLVFLFNKGIFAPGHPVFLPQYPQFCAPIAFVEQPQRLLHFEVKNLIHIFSTALALIEGVFSRHLTEKN